MTGPYWPYYWALIFCNIVTPQILWFKKIRMNVPVLFVVSHHRQRRHVARAVRDRGHQPASRFSAVVVGHVPPDALGLVDVSSARSGCS